MQNEQRIELINNAIELINEAQALVDEALAGTGEEAEYRAYGRYGFDRLLNNGNPYDNGLQNVIENLNV